MTPSVGRIVHIVGDNKECVAAIVSEVSPATCFLFVIQPKGTRWYFVAAPYDEDQKQIGSWHWPERIE